MKTREVTMSAHAKRVLQWKESLVLLNEERFFEIMRIYLGEIKTPYNKQNLIAQLQGFLHREENLLSLINLLSETDLIILCAVVFIPDVTEEKLCSFFSGEFSFATLSEAIVNLEERLILYRYKNDDTLNSVLAINPILEDVLEPYIFLERLLPIPQNDSYNDFENYKNNPSNEITNEMIASFISYISFHPDLCKIDSSFKKITLTDLQKIFPSSIKNLEILIKAFCHLGLVHEAKNGYELDWKKLELFASLPEYTRKAYIAVASCLRLSRETIRRYAQLLLDTIQNIPEDGYSERTLLRLGFLTAARPAAVEATCGFASQSRFSQMLNRASQSENTTGSEKSTQDFTASDSVITVLEMLLTPAVATGLLGVKENIETGEKIYFQGTQYKNGNESETTQGAISIDAGFSVTLMRGFSLQKLLPLMKFLNILQYDTVAVFEITKHSSMRAYDLGLSSNNIIQILENYSSYKISETLKVSLEEWNSSYSSVSLYSGYILKVTGKNAILVEHNPLVAPHISEILAPGIFLLDITSEEDAYDLIKKSGLDFIGKAKTGKTQSETIGFLPLQNNKNSESFKSKFDIKKIWQISDNLNIESNLQNDSKSNLKEKFQIGTKESREKYYEKLLSLLEKENFDSEQKEGLELRIRRGVILNPEQIHSSFIRVEKTTADGMDLSGKIYILEQAIKFSELVELRFDYSGETVLGFPLLLDKHNTKITVQIRLEPDKTVKTFSVSQTSSIKRFRKSIFR